MRIGILTVSDRSSRGERIDLSGPALMEVAQAQGWRVVRTDIVPDVSGRISNKLAEWADSSELDVILSTGGTGLPRGT